MPILPQVEKVSPSASGRAALQKKAISAIAANSPVNSVVMKNTENPARLASADRRTIARRIARRSASQPHRVGASTRISCISDISKAMSVAVSAIDCR